jgi:hypothetical protein
MVVGDPRRGSEISCKTKQNKNKINQIKIKLIKFKIIIIIIIIKNKLNK